MYGREKKGLGENSEKIRARFLPRLKGKDTMSVAEAFKTKGNLSNGGLGAQKEIRTANVRPLQKNQKEKTTLVATGEEEEFKDSWELLNQLKSEGRRGLGKTRPGPPRTKYKGLTRQGSQRCQRNFTRLKVLDPQRRTSSANRKQGGVGGP